MHNSKIKWVFNSQCSQVENKVKLSLSVSCLTGLLPRSWVSVSKHRIESVWLPGLPKGPGQAWALKHSRLHKANISLS